MRTALDACLPDEAVLPFSCRLTADCLASAGSAATLAVTAASLLLAGSRIPLQVQDALVAGECPQSQVHGPLSVTPLDHLATHAVCEPCLADHVVQF